MIKNKWNKFKEGLFTRAQFLTGAAIAMITTSVVVYAVQSLSLTTFTANTSIRSSEVNANFSQLSDVVKKASGYKMVLGLNSNLSFSASTSLPIEFDSVILDNTPENYSDDIMDDGTLTITSDGFYNIRAMANTVSSSSTELRIMRLRGTSTVILSSTTIGYQSDNIPYLTSQNEQFLKENDEVWVQIYGYSSNVLNSSQTKLIFERIDI